MVGKVLLILISFKVLSISYFFDSKTPFWTSRLLDVQTYSRKHRIPYRLITDDRKALSIIANLSKRGFRVSNLEFRFPIEYTEFPVFLITTDKHVYKVIGDAPLGEILRIIMRKEGVWK